MKMNSYHQGKNSPNIEGNVSSSHFGDINYLNTLKNKSVQVVTISDLIILIGEKAQSTLREDTEKSLVEKLDKRFPAYKELISERYVELLEVYSLSYDEAKKYASINDSLSDKITLYLRGISRKYLHQCDNDPVKALDKMIIFFSEELDKRFVDSDIDYYDHCAIEYYLYKELINCNVFPNPLD